MANWYCSSVDYAAVPVWVASTAVTTGTIRRQLATPAQGSERCFRCTTAGTTGATEPTWILTKNGVTSADGTAAWTECTGQALFNGDGGGTAWGAPFACLLTVTTAFMTTGDTLYVRNTHSYTYNAATAMSLGGSTPIMWLCTNASTLPPTAASLTTGALETTSGAFTFTIASGGGGIIQGVSFSAGSGANTAAMVLPSSISGFQLINSTLSLGGTAGGSFSFNPSGTECFRMRNVTLNFSAANQTIGTGTGAFSGTWVGGSVTGTAPTSLFTTGSNRNLNGQIRDVDLSLVTGTLITMGTGQNGSSFELVNCKLGAGATLTSSTTVAANLGKPAIRIVNCDSGATNYRYRMCTGGAVVDQETAIIRSGGANDGVTPISWKMASASNQTVGLPAFFDDIFQWNTLVGSAKTASVFLTTNTSLTNANCWVELEYLGTSGSTLGTMVSTYAGLLVAGTALTTDTSTWGGTAQTNKYRIDIGFTPQVVGLVRARVWVAAASATIYLDPELVVA